MRPGSTISLALAAWLAAALVPSRAFADMTSTVGGAVATVSAYAGSITCKPCHSEQYSAWSSSGHASAMRGSTTRASFSGAAAAFGKDRTASIDFPRGDDPLRAVVRETAGYPVTYLIPYVFGARSLEQFLASGDKGRLQALPVGFDTARKEWFDIFSGEERRPGDFGHWLGRGMNANSQCITCHATGYQSGYSAASDSYSSTWKEMGVTCESCHGPGGAHAADPKQPYGPFGRISGIAAFRPKPAGAGDEPAIATVATSSVPPPAARQMLDVCATCHSIRRPIADGFIPGADFLDHYDPTLIDEDNYWPNGQVRTESYEWGSFVQSRMYQKGVNCLACHDVHSGELRAEGKVLCLSCHEHRYAESSHTAHKPESAGSQCVACHMPESVFMARDHRRDHSLSIPDPLLARDIAAPSACQTCHADRGRERLADDAEQLWPALTGTRLATRRAAAKAFATARDGDRGSVPALRECLAGVSCGTSILRASAAKLLAPLPFDDATVLALLGGLDDSDALVRNASAFALADLDPRSPALQQHLLTAATDRSRAVRINAAWALRTLDVERLPSAQSKPVVDAYKEWRAAAALLDDAPETWHSLGVFEAARRDPVSAESAYRRAIAMEPRAVPSRYNLAMLLVGASRIDDAKKELDELTSVDDSLAAAWYALGIIHGEQKRWADAAKALGRCLKLDPAYPGALTDLTHAYLEASVPNVARAVLGGAVAYPAARREALAGLVVVALKSGTHDEAVAAAKALLAEDPSAISDPEIARLAAEPAVNSPAGAAPAAPQTPATGAAAPM